MVNVNGDDRRSDLQGSGDLHRSHGESDKAVALFGSLGS